MTQGKNTARKKRSLFGSILFIIAIPLVTGLFSFSREHRHSPVLLTGQENHPPVVKIVSPKANSLYDENAQVRYEIEVSDKEDGESKFQEIPPNEIFLEVRYFKDATRAAAALKASGSVKADLPGLATIKASNCLNCHAFNAKLIGPSFYDISKRYPYTKSNADTLARRILNGTAGVWGSIQMPTHPELTKEQAADIVSWILKRASDPVVNYYTGTEGAFRIKTPSTLPGKNKGAFVLTASYTDHGLKDATKQRLKGQDMILLRVQ